MDQNKTSGKNKEASVAEKYVQMQGEESEDRFFIQAGSRDGISFSNAPKIEMERKWKGEVFSLSTDKLAN